MKNKYVKYYLPLIACLMLGFDFKETIEWQFEGKPIVRFTSPQGVVLDLGLRSDGLVVWRKVTNTTNSPSEKVNNMNEWYRGQIWLNNSGTNNVIPLNN